MQLCGFRLSHFDPLAEYQTDKQNRRKQTRDAKTNKQTNKKHTQQSLQSRLIEMIQMHCNSFQANWPSFLLGKLRHKWELLAALECPRSPPVEVWTALKKCLYASKSNCFLRKPSIFVKPWPNGLASRRKSPTWVSFGHLLAWTLVKLKFAGKSTQVFHRLATQRKSAQVDRKSTVYVWNLRFLRLAWACEPTCESVWPPFASPYASSGFANLWRLALTCDSVW